MKHYFILFLSSLLFNVLNYSISTGGDCKISTTEFYSTLPLRESPYPEFKGAVRITYEQAMKRNHYRFEYDEIGRLCEVTFRLGDTIISPNHTANYFFQTSIQRFEYSENKEIRTFYDKHGNQTHTRGAYKEIYVKDERGKTIELYFEDLSGEKVQNNWGITKYTWDLQPDGSVIEERFDENGEIQRLRPAFPFYRIRLVYEQNGMLGIMQNVDNEGNLIENETGAAQDKLEFDAYGRWFGWNVLDKSGNLEKGNGPDVAKGINTPNEWGYEASLRFEDENGNPVINSHGFWGSKRFYDEYGNYDYTHFSDKDGNPGPNQNSGYTYVEYTFAENNIDRTLIELLDKNRLPTSHKTRGYSKIKQEYDGAHNLIKTSFLDVHGNLVNRIDNGVAYITITYNDKMVRTNTRMFDKDGIEL